MALLSSSYLGTCLHNLVVTHRPSDIIVLTGPPDAGKTAVLQQVVVCRKSEARATLYINCREKDYMSSQAATVEGD